jgi:hypothetical protein
MKKGSMGGLIVGHFTIASIFVFVAFLVFFLAPVAHAQTASYWCLIDQGASYWSNQPCGYAYQYNYQQYNYPQYNYPYQNYYYPTNYYYPYQNNQYYYPAPTCSITYSYTNNPGYWSGGMYTQAIQLTWSSNYASNAYINGIGAVSPSGTRVVYPYGFTQYTMTVYGSGGSNTCSTYYQPAQYNQQPYWNQYNYGYPY